MEISKKEGLRRAVREDVILAPAGDIEQRARWQEGEAGLREVHAALADHHGVE